MWLRLDPLDFIPKKHWPNVRNSAVYEVNPLGQVRILRNVKWVDKKSDGDIYRFIAGYKMGHAITVVKTKQELITKYFPEG